MTKMFICKIARDGQEASKASEQSFASIVNVHKLCCWCEGSSIFTACSSLSVSFMSAYIVMYKCLYIVLICRSVVLSMRRLWYSQYQTELSMQCLLDSDIKRDSILMQVVYILESLRSVSEIKLQHFPKQSRWFRTQNL